MPPDPDATPSLRSGDPDAAPSVRSDSPDRPAPGEIPWRPRPTPMSEPWAFPDDPPPRQVGLAIGLALVAIGGLVAFLIAVIIVTARW